MNDESRKAQRQELRVARLTRGRASPGSGSSWRRPHDVRSTGKLWEMKRTNGKTMTLKLADLDAVHKRALVEGREPVLHLEFGNRRFVVLPEDDYLALGGDDGGDDRGSTR